MRATSDITAFATLLSQSAQTSLLNARLVRQNFAGVTLQDPIEHRSFDPELQLPFWPCPEEGQPTRDWQQSSAGVVTLPFLQGIVEATKAIQSEAHHSLEQCEAFPVAASERYAGVGDRIRQDFLYPVDDYVQAAEACLIGNETLPPDVTDTVYDNAHDGYLRASWSFTVVAAPALLGY